MELKTIYANKGWLTEKCDQLAAIKYGNREAAETEVLQAIMDTCAIQQTTAPSFISDDTKLALQRKAARLCRKRGA